MLFSTHCMWGHTVEKATTSSWYLLHVRTHSGEDNHLMLFAVVFKCIQVEVWRCEQKKKTCDNTAVELINTWKYHHIACGWGLEGEKTEKKKQKSGRKRTTPHHSMSYCVCVCSQQNGIQCRNYSFICILLAYISSWVIRLTIIYFQ